MRILIVPTSYPNRENPVCDIFIYEQAYALAMLGNEIRVLHLRKRPSVDVLRKINRRVSVEDDGFALRYLKEIKTFKESRFLRIHRSGFIRGMKQLYKAATADGWKPDVIYAHFSCWAGVAAAEIGREARVPVAAIEHYSGYMAKTVGRSCVKGLLETINASQQMLCVSESLKNAICRLTNTSREIVVIPNMVDGSFTYKRPQSCRCFTFCAVCNLTAHKRVDLLIDAFCGAFSPDDNVRLTIGGDGPERKRLEKQIERRKAQNRITMLGRLSRRETVDLYQRSHVFALASERETFGIVWREAMSTGCPVITTDHGGWSERDWKNDFGIMIPVNDLKALTDAMKQIKANYAHYQTEEIARFVHENYAETVVGQRIEKVLRKVVADAGK